MRYGGWWAGLDEQQGWKGGVGEGVDEQVGLGCDVR